jgi:predicted metal-dependent peptidase
MGIAKSPRPVQLISARWFFDAPFFYTFLQNFIYVKTREIDTIAVGGYQGKLRLYYNPDFIDELLTLRSPLIFDSNSKLISENDKIYTFKKEESKKILRCMFEAEKYKNVVKDVDYFKRLLNHITGLKININSINEIPNILTDEIKKIFMDKIGVEFIFTDSNKNFHVDKKDSKLNGISFFMMKLTNPEKIKKSDFEDLNSVMMMLMKIGKSIGIGEVKQNIMMITDNVQKIEEHTRGFEIFTDDAEVKVSENVIKIIPKDSVTLIETKPNNDYLLEGVLIHEIFHVISVHADRCGERDHELFNQAADICINEKVIESTINGRKLVLPENRCRLEEITALGYDGTLITEEIYDFLEKQFPPNSGGKDGNLLVGGGNGDGDEGDGNRNSIGGESRNGKGGISKNFDSHEKLEEIDEITKNIIGGLIQDAKSRGYGNISGGMVDYITELLTSKINWKKVLRKYMKGITIGGILKRATWDKVNRRNLPLMGKKKESPQWYVGIDTSGSVSNNDLAMFFGEIESIAKNGKIHLLQCDTELTDSGIYKKGSWNKIEIKGRGGTELSPFFKYMIDNKVDKSKLIILTDGCMCYDEIKEIGSNIETLWVLLPNCTNYIEEIKSISPKHHVICMEKN